MQFALIMKNDMVMTHEALKRKLLLTKNSTNIIRLIKRVIQKMTIPMNRMKKSRMIESGNAADVDSVK